MAVIGTAAIIACAIALGIAAVRTRLAVERVLVPDRVTRGESCTVRLTLRNENRFRALTVIATDRCGEVVVDVPVSHLGRGRQTLTEYVVPTSRRGVVEIGPLRIVRPDPLGLVSTSRAYGASGRVWVHPVAHPICAVPAGIARSLEGRVDNVPHGNGAFDSLREYVIGDDLRNVHWRTTARVGALMVRERTDTSLPVVIVVLDDRTDAHTADSFEEACEAAASIAVAAIREGLEARLRLVSGVEVTGRGVMNAYLDALAEATLGAEGTDIRPVVDQLRVGRYGDTLVFLTGPGGLVDMPRVAALRGVYPVVVAGLFGESAAAPVTSPGLLVLATPTACEFAAAWDGVGRW